MTSKCDCWQKTADGYVYDYGVCLGTKECEPCDCGGDELKCDFYPKKREDAAFSIRRHYVLNHPMSTHDVVNQTYNIEAVIQTKILNLAEESVVQAVVEEARLEGVTDLYLLDKKFVIEALIEKMERECKVK